MRVLLSEDCNANCPHCFNRGFRKAGHMDTARAKRVFELLGQQIESLLIMGGEPTLHPDFPELYRHAQRCFKNVGLFTNAINDALLQISPRPTDGITYNARFVGSRFDFAKMHPGAEFARALDVVITDSDVDELKPRLIGALNGAARAGIDDLVFVLTLDISAKNLEHREELNRSWRSLVSFIGDLGVERLGTDHPVPRCFWDEESMLLNTRLPFIGRGGVYPSICSLKSAGLLNAQFELLHCNQYPVQLGSIFEGPENDDLIPLSRLIQLLEQSHRLRMQKIARRDDCQQCEYFPDQCNGGCFILRSETEIDLSG